MSRPTSWGKGERGEPGVPERRGEPRGQTWDFRGPCRLGRSGGDAPDSAGLQGEEEEHRRGDEQNFEDESEGSGLGVFSAM